VPPAHTVREQGSLDRLGFLVAGHGDLRELRGSGEFRRGGEPVSLDAEPPSLPGPLRGKAVQGGILPQPGGPGDPGQ